MGIFKFMLGVVAGIFLASHNPDLAESIREGSIALYHAVFSVVAK